jgi:hypothetical protein
MTTAVPSFWSKIANEPAVLVGVAVAGLNAATVQTWQGYASAVAVALLRFLVGGPFTSAPKPPPPPPAH